MRSVDCGGPAARRQNDLRAVAEDPGDTYHANETAREELFARMVKLLKGIWNGGKVGGYASNVSAAHTPWMRYTGVEAR